ncbi:hypothetical protein Golomagni_05615 [Golovinomyces magnicellulatus]|nr:hypothetical protein Golomagni_05615 [Golovinomyces magnicellulatus]
MSKSTNLPPIEDLLEGNEGWHDRITESSDEIALATYTAKLMRQAVDIELCDDNLLYAYEKDFENWNKDIKEIFLSGKNNGRISHQFSELLKIEESLEWSEKEKATTIFHPQGLFERENLSLFKNPPSTQDPSSKPVPLPTLIPEQSTIELPYRTTKRPI